MNIQEFLGQQNVAFDVLQHRETFDAQRMAQAVHVSGHHVAKTVLLKVGEPTEYTVVVLPATHNIDFDMARKVLGTEKVELATEAEMSLRCPNCDVGALPPFGSQYEMKTVVDKSLTEDEEINKLRKSILQMIISECGEEIQQSRDIRYWMRRYKITENRFKLPQKEEIVDDSSEVLVKDPNRCILCGKCVRACANLSGQKVINFANRGSTTATITGLNEPFGSTNCANCLACAHYCPTNAIIPKSVVKKISGYPFWTMISYPKKMVTKT